MNIYFNINTMLSVSKDIMRMIMSQLDTTSIRSLSSTCTHLHSIYTPRERLDVVPIINGKRRCINCKLNVKSERYNSHFDRCIYIKDRHSHGHYEKRIQKNVTCDTEYTICLSCSSIHSSPHIKSSGIEHPYIVTECCGKGITNKSAGCLYCTFYCSSIKCRFCYKSYPKCKKHVCEYPSKIRWFIMLSHESNFCGIRYDNDSLIAMDKYIHGKAYHDTVVYINWYFVDVETYELDPGIANGHDLYFIVDKNSCKLKDSDLLYLNLGCLAVEKGWVNYSKLGL